MLILIAIVIAVLLSTFAGWELWRFISPGTISTGENFIQKQIKYQSAFLVVACIIVALSYAVSVKNSSQVFGIGDLNSAVHFEAFGLALDSFGSWLQFGTVFTLVLGVATYVTCYSSFFGVTDWTLLLRSYGGWVIVFSAVNALSEELIYRGSIVAAAEGQLHPWQTALLSAVLFSIAHVRGQINGIIVVIGSAIIGWFLAQTVLQTHGLFLAWCAHFVQDLVIFVIFFAKLNRI